MQCSRCQNELMQAGQFWVCPVHGESPAQTARTAPEGTAARRVFISYGRGDAHEFVRQLAADLAARGLQVWLDLESIEKGGLFEVRIEQGIRASEVVAAVMTPHSVREESICRDEVAFAINEHKPVVPLLVTPNVQPTLLLARRNWIDFTASYEQGLTALLRFLAGDRAAGLPPRLPTVTGVLPLDFGPEIARYAANFTGREWLFTDLRRWLATQTKPVLVIVGEPGIGKSAIAARLALTWPEVLGIHFCTHRNSRSLDPYEFVGSLVGQLHALLPGFAAVVEARHPEERRLTASDAFRELIVEPTRALPEANAAKLLVIDSLDEASVPSGETVLDVLVRHAEDLPPWLRIVATTRPEARILDQIRTLRCFELRADIPENKADLQQYIQNRLGPAAGGAAARLMELASGNFLYARHALDALGDGTLSLPSLGTLTPGLSAFYRTIFARLFPDMAVYDRDYGPLLRALAAARGPLPLAVFQRLTAAEPESLHRRLRLLRSYLRAIGEGQTAAHTFYHQSLRDWLTNAEEAGDYWLDVRKGHALLAGALADAWPAEEYALRHLPYHLAAARGADDLADLLSTPEFLEAKVEAGLVFGLVKDFAEAVRVLPDRHPRRHILTLLEEAIRRDIHFLARHPTTLFQCLWNSCWWYDCPEAAAHYEVPEEGWQAAQAPWEQPGPKLHELLEAWRMAKEEVPEFPWLRSVRPPAVPLGAGQHVVLLGHKAGVRGVAVSPGGQWIASASEDGTVRVWGADTGEEIRCLIGHDGSVSSVAFSPDGRWLLSGSCDGTVRVWDAATGEERRCLRGHQSEVLSVAFSPDGQWIVSGSHDRTVRVWDTATGGTLRCLRGHKDEVSGVAVSLDGRRIVSGSHDRTVRVWDREGGEELRCLRGLSGREWWVWSVAFSPDGRRIASGCGDQTVRVWDAETGEEVHCFRGHRRSVTSVAFSPDGAWIASGSGDETVRLWDTETGSELRCMRGHNDRVGGVAFSPDGRRIISGSRDQTVQVWDVETRTAHVSLRGHKDRASSATFSPDWWEEISPSKKTWNRDRVWCIAFSPDGRHIASGSGDNTVRIWDVNTGRELRRLSGHESDVRSLAFSPDGSRIVSGSYDQTLRVWDAGGGREVRCLRGHEWWVLSVVFSPDGRMVASGGGDETVRVWDVETGQELHRLCGHRGRVMSVAFSPDGLRIASGSGNQTVRIWDTEAGKELRCLRGHEGEVSNVIFSPDGRRVVSRSVDGTVRVWDSETGECIEVIEDKSDITSIALGSGAFPLRAVSIGSETVIEQVATGEPVAWFPIALEEIKVYPAGQTWAGASGNYLCIFRLEGGPDR